MASTDLPSASVSVSAQASGSGAGDGLIAVITPVATLGDGVPRIYSNGTAALAAHGYSPGISYAALHAEVSKRPFVVVGIPIATDGAASAVVSTGAAGTSVITLTAGSDGVLTDMDATLTVLTGGTIETAGIVLGLSIDGGAITKTIRLGTATSYTIPDVGLRINFGAGTMLLGDVHTWTATGPAWDSAGMTLARTGMAAAQIEIRSWLVDGQLDATDAGLVVTAAETYASSNSRFVIARATTEDLSEATWALEATAQRIAYDAVSSTDGRLSLGFGRRRILCPLTGWAFRRSAAWAASLREYERGYDIHNTTWWRKRGPLGPRWFTVDGDVEHDERVDGGALAGQFTCFTSLDNESGIYIAKDLTRASADSPLLLPSNVHVTNAICTIIQRETTRTLGQDLIKQADGTIDPNQAVDLEETVNSALARGIMRQQVAGRGARASSVRATLSRDDDLTGPDAVLTWVIETNLRGVVSRSSAQVKVY